MKKYLAVLLAVLMLVSMITGCSQPAPEVEDNPEPVATKAPEKAEEPEVEPVADEGALKLTWNLLNNTQSGFQPIINAGNCFETTLIWDTLLRYDAEAGEYIPVLAESYEISDDGTKHTIVLKDAKFHDGEPVTADDVLFTYNFNLLAAGADSGNLMGIKGAQDVADGKADAISGIYAVDEKTVVFEFNNPNFAFDYYLADGCFGILPEHILGQMSWSDALENEEYWANPIGAGPYKFEGAVYPNYCTLTRFDDYHSAPAGIKNIQLTYYADVNANIAALMAGDADMLYGVTPNDVDTALAANSDLESVVMPANNCRVLVINMSNKEGAREDLKNVRVRQALNMIIDKQMIADYVGITGSTATTFSAGSAFNADIPAWERDLEGGKRILEEENFDFETPLRLYGYYTDQETIDIFDIIVANLAEAGITAEYVIDGQNTWNILYENVAFDLAYAGNSGIGMNPYTFFDPGNVYDVWYTEDQLEMSEERYGSFNDQYNATNDATVRHQLLDEVQINFMEDMLMIPVWFSNTAWVINTAHVQGMEPYSYDYAVVAYLNVADWSLVG